MANKLFLICATLALCFLLINASSYRTTVEFDDEDATNPSGPFRNQKCEREFQPDRRLTGCQDWIRRQVKQGLSSGPALEDDEFDFEDNIENRHPVLQKCCSELHREDPDCVCSLLEQAGYAIRRQEPDYSKYEDFKIFNIARFLPIVCKVPKVPVCYRL